VSGPPDLKLAFVPLNDAAVLIAAKAKGFFAGEGLRVQLSREVSWATVRDKVQFGAVDGAHLLGAVALASSLGAGSEPAPLIAPMALHTGGAALTLASRLGAIAGPTPDASGVARLIERRREEGASQLTFAIVFPYSTHNYLLRDWLAEAGVRPDEDVKLMVAPPSRMAGLLADGVIEGFCAGEPWNAAAVAAGVGAVVMRAAEARSGAPDKVLAVTEAWGEAHPDILQALLRALLKAAAWAQAAENRAELVAVLAQPEHVGADPAIIAAGLADIRFHGAATTSPMPAHAVWLLHQMARWGQIGADVDTSRVAARVFREDLHDQALTSLR
jgi:ABC-type nitrate/sulfonate/bicarbonate transport system substrate-binding protein